MRPISAALALRCFVPLLVATTVTEIDSSGNSLRAKLAFNRTVVAAAVGGVTNLSSPQVRQIACAVAGCRLDPAIAVAAEAAFRSARNTLWAKLLLETARVAETLWCLPHGAISGVGAISCTCGERCLVPLVFIATITAGGSA